MISQLWNSILKTPLKTALLFIYGYTQNLGLSILILTIILQLVLTPLRLPQLRSAQKMQKIKPELDGLKKKHGHDRTALAQAQMEVYRKHGISPLGGILPTVLSLVIVIALYQVLLQVLQNGQGLNTNFLWLDVAQPDPYYILPIVTGAVQWLSSRILLAPSSPAPYTDKQKKGQPDKAGSLEDTLQSMQGQMQLFFPLFTVIIMLRLPSGVAFYWLASLIFGIIQQKLIGHDEHRDPTRDPNDH